MSKIRVGILGATGIVGQQYISLLKNHPQFEVTFLAASSQSANKIYSKAVEGRWHIEHSIPQEIADLNVFSIDSLEESVSRCNFVFSALDSSTALLYEEKYANYGLPVVSNASAHRFTKDVPILIPEINSDHLEIIPYQKAKNGWDKGFIVVKPNCSLQSYLLPLFALDKEFRLDKIMVTTMQAISGAGHPGVPSLNVMDNIIPFIKGEEEKSELEPLKILGRHEQGEIIAASHFRIAAHCNRVPVTDGHLACVSVSFNKKPTVGDILGIWKGYRGVPQKLNLFSAPKQPIVYCYETDRPQPRLDRMKEDGMAVCTGRLRECPILDFRFVGLSHNTVRGAAGGGILNAELLVAKKWIG